MVLAAPPQATGAAGGVFSVIRQTGATLGVAAGTAAIGADIAHGRQGHALIAVAAAIAALAWRLVTSSSSRRSQASMDAR